MAGLYSWLVNKIRTRRYAFSSNVKMLNFGAIYTGHYSNYKHDPSPLIFCMYSDAKYTHAINIHYLDRYEKEWLGRMIYIIKKAGQIVDGRLFYNFFKTRRPRVPKVAYRVYFTSLLDVKMASAGLTPLDGMEYKVINDPFIIALNEMIKPSEMARPPNRISYMPTELRDKIIAAKNAIPIKQQRVGGAFGTAPYIK